MLHPSYSDLMQVVNSDVVEGEQPVVQSRYSIVLATAKRARQIVAGEDSLIKGKGKKPLSIAVEELYKGKIKILSEEEAAELAAEKALKKELEAAKRDNAKESGEAEDTEADEAESAETTDAKEEEAEDAKDSDEAAEETEDIEGSGEAADEAEGTADNTEADETTEE